MPIPVSDKGGQDFDPISAGTHHAICYGVVDIGTQPNLNPQYPDYRKVCILWELPGERADFPDKDDKSKKVNKARAISGIYTLSLSEKANLRKILEAWRAKTFSQDELQGFDISKLIGANCLLSVVHKPGAGKNAGRTFANVASVSALPKGMSKAQPENPSLYFSMFDLQGGDEITFPANMPEWLVNKVKQSKEYSERQDERNPAPPPTAQENLDEDVPFN